MLNYIYGHVQAIPTYRVYRLYDKQLVGRGLHVHALGGGGKGAEVFISSLKLCSYSSSIIRNSMYFYIASNLNTVVSRKRAHGQRTLH